MALVFHTDLDSPFRPTFIAGSADSAFNASRHYTDDISDRKFNYDVLLIITFVACVPGYEHSVCSFIRPHGA